MARSSSILYQAKDCPCPADCVRHGKCKECIAFHHNRGQDTYCEVLDKKFNNEQSTGTDAGKPNSGKEIRLLDYTKCAG